MYKKNLTNKTINLLEYYSILNITNFFSDTAIKSKKQLFINKEKYIFELFKEINVQLNIKKINSFFYKGNLNSKIMILGDCPNDDDIKNQEIFS